MAVTSPGDWRKLGALYPAGDWRILLRDYKAGRAAVLPEEFRRWLAEQWAQFKGRTDVVNATWRFVVYEVWLKGAPVPAYGTIDDWCRRTGRNRPHPDFVRDTELPAGWTSTTFRRYLPKREATRRQVAHGYLAAHGSQPDQVLTDRAPLLPLQYVFLDDSRPDVRGTWFGAGKGEIVYPLLVMGLDACSGVDLEAVTKPRALKEEGGGRHGVTQDMALRVVLGVLRRFGLPPWPITFVHENAAACVPADARHALREMYGERIQFEATGIFKERMLEHGFGEQGGAPYDKAPIEAFWRILMTQLARLPGSTGPRYDAMPGDLPAIEDYTGKLMAKAGGVEAVFALFRSPLLEWAELDAAIMAALRLLRFRIQHKLQGFERVREWRRSPAEEYQPWSQFLSLPIEEQNIISNAGGDNIITRMECPAERFCRKMQGAPLTPVDPDFLSYVQGPREPVRVRDGKITVKRVALGDDPIIFRETGHELLGEEFEGKPLEGVLVEDGARIVLADAGRILGSVAAQGRVVRGTEEAKREMGRVRAARTADREHLRGYLLADTDTALAELRAHNTAVLASPALAAAAVATAIEEKQTTRTRAKKQTAAQQNRNSDLSRRRAARAEAQLKAASTTH
jgi:hypothetical protein